MQIHTMTTMNHDETDTIIRIQTLRDERTLEQIISEIEADAALLLPVTVAESLSPEQIGLTLARACKLTVAEAKAQAEADPHPGYWATYFASENPFAGGLI